MQEQTPANPAQPVAAAFVNPATSAAPTSQSETTLSIADQTKARTRPSPGFSQASASTDTATAEQTQTLSDEAPASDSSANNSVATADQLGEAQTPKAQAAPDGIPGQIHAPAANDTPVQAQTGGTIAANADRGATQAVESSSAPAITSTANAANTQGGVQDNANAAKIGIDGLPNFGFTPASGTTQSATSATAASGATPGVTVPISGLAVAIAARAQAGSNQFDISLSPPELGRIDVQLNIDGNGQVTSHMTVDRPETLQLLQSQQPQLQNALDQAGLKTADNGLQFSLRDQSMSGQNNGPGSQPQSPTAAAQVIVPEPDLPPIAAVQAYARAGLGSGVDIRV